MFESIAYAAEGQAAQQGGGMFMSLSMIILMFAVFYFLLIRPQQKRQQELQKTVEALKKGDRIITTGGVIGTITSIQNDYVVIRAGESDAAKMEVLKSAVSGLRGVPQETK